MHIASKNTLHHPNAETGLSLIETLIVLVIIGMVAAMIVPNAISRPDDARVTVATTEQSYLPVHIAGSRGAGGKALGISARRKLALGRISAGLPDGPMGARICLPKPGPVRRL